MPGNLQQPAWLGGAGVTSSPCDAAFIPEVVWHSFHLQQPGCVTCQHPYRIFNPQDCSVHQVQHCRACAAGLLHNLLVALVNRHSQQTWTEGLGSSSASSSAGSSAESPDCASGVCSSASDSSLGCSTRSFARLWRYDLNCRKVPAAPSQSGYLFGRCFTERLAGQGCAHSLTTARRSAVDEIWGGWAYMQRPSAQWQCMQSTHRELVAKRGK